MMSEQFGAAHDNLAFEPDGSVGPEKNHEPQVSSPEVNKDVEPNPTQPEGPGNWTHSYGPNETRRMTKNIVIVSIGFLLLFTAYNGMSNLLSSFYPEGGLGTFTNATVYGFLIISSLFLPTFVMQKITVKWSLVLSMLGYTFYMAAQYHPRFYTLLPGAMFVGIAAAPLWASKSFYLTHLGNQYAELIQDKAEIIIIRFFGIFFMFFQSSQIWGNLISSTILSTGEKRSPNFSQLEKCGYKFCPGDLDSPDDDDVTDEEKRKIYIYSGICLGCAFAAIGIVATFMDPLLRYGERERIETMERKTGWRLILATTHQMQNPYQLLIVPLTIFSGLEQGFLSTDFTQAFITCSWGVHNVGYVLICYGVVDAILSISFGPVVRKFGRMPVYTFGAIGNIAMIVTMLSWFPNPDQPYVLFLIAAFWGMSDAIWQTQINALYGVLFQSNEEAAFSNYRLWESLGFIIAYVNGNLLCIKAKLYILGAVLIVGLTGFYVIEFKEIQIRRKSQSKLPRSSCA